MTSQTSRIRDYAAIGDCRTAALVSRSGSIDWCCFSRFDAPSTFARLLDPAGGHFSITPTEPFDSEQTYLDATNILQTRFRSPGGTAVIRDLFSVRDTEKHENELWPNQEILRLLEVTSGSMDFELEFEPRPRYGQVKPKLRRLGHWGIRCDDADEAFVLQCSLPCSALRLIDGKGAAARFRLQAGQKMITSLAYADEAPAVLPALECAERRFALSIDYWRSWSRRCRAAGPYGPLIRRSALALKLLNFAPSGAFVAAPTTSLPENPGGSRNWDYRFCWLRDASFTTRALLELGYVEEAKAYLNWLIHTTRLSWPRLQILYNLYGEHKLGERSAGWLRGFERSRPVRLGNAASTQLQLDVYGEVIDSFHSLSSHLHPIDSDTRRMILGFGRAVADLWTEPDSGLWEVRGEPRHYTHSKLMCWVAMDRLGKLRRKFSWKLNFDVERVAEEIREDIENRAFNPEVGAYTRSRGESVLDSSLLVMPLVGYCHASAPRYRSTVKAILKNLEYDGLLYRYPPGSDGLSEPEGAFTLCSLWLAEAYARGGCLAEAEYYFSAVTRRLAPHGLAAEEFSTENYEYLGNYPQGFSHVGLINAALALTRARQAQRKSA